MSWLETAVPTAGLGSEKHRRIRRSRKQSFVAVVAVLVLSLLQAACTSDPLPIVASPVGAFDTNGDGVITVGFSYTSNHDFIYKGLLLNFKEQNGFELNSEYADGPEEQESVLTQFIDKSVEMIIVDPVPSTDLEPILRQAKEAGIPAVIIGPYVPAQEDLVLFRFVKDYWQEGTVAAQWLSDEIAKNGITDPIRVLHLHGPAGSDHQTERIQGFMDGRDWQIVHRISSDNSSDSMNEMISILQQGGGADFNVVFSE